MKLLLIYIILIAVHGTAGCTNGVPVEEVVERSKASTPAWVSAAEDQAASDNLRISYIAARSHLQDLPLAVRKTQALTLTESEMNLRGITTEKLSSLAASKGITIINHEHFRSLISKVVKRHHDRHAKVSDIYYEKLRRNGSGQELEEYYRVYVKVDYFRQHLPDLAADIQKSFKSSGHNDLKKISAEMSDGFQQLLGH